MGPLAIVKRLLAKVTLVIEFCHDCGVRQPVVWTATDGLWAEVMGGPSGVVCPACFDKRAEAKGLMLRWEPTLERRRFQP